MNRSLVSLSLPQDTGIQVTPQQFLRSLREYNPESYGYLVQALAYAQLQVYEDEQPHPRPGESDEDYQKRLEAFLMELIGRTTANNIMSAKGYVGIWLRMILEHGLTMIPDWMDDDSDGIDARKAKSLEVPLYKWFRQTQLEYAVAPSELSRIIHFLLEVVPQARRFARIDEGLVSLLIDEKKGFSFPRKARLALDAFRKARGENGGKVPEELARVVAKHLSRGEADVEEMIEEVANMGYTTSGVRRVKMVIPGVAFVVNREDGEEGMDILIRATGRDQIEFLEQYLQQGPFDIRNDLGPDADAARRQYVPSFS